jgi:hypothetical protein
MSDTRQASGVVPVIEPDAVEYAKAQGIEGVVRQLAEATARLYPTARSVRVLIRPDAEIPDYWFVIFEVRVPHSDVPDVPDVLAAERRWIPEYLRIYPYPRNHSLLLRLISEERPEEANPQAAWARTAQA